MPYTDMTVPEIHRALLAWMQLRLDRTSRAEAWSTESAEWLKVPRTGNEKAPAALLYDLHLNLVKPDLRAETGSGLPG